MKGGADYTFIITYNIRIVFNNIRKITWYSHFLYVMARTVYIVYAMLVLSNLRDIYIFVEY